jgi:D-amino-acid oxidase
VVVVGAGAIGMATALVLQERGHRVEVWAKHEPAATVSAVAGAIWYPFLAEPRERVRQWAAVTWRRLAELARDPASGVAMQVVTEVFATAEPDLWWAAAVPSLAWLPPAAVPAGRAAAVQLEVPVCDVPVHLPWLWRTFVQRGGVVRQRAVTSLDEAFAAAPCVVNCTGLGAAALCGDRSLQPVRGQVVVVERKPGIAAWIDDTGAAPCYVIPRGDEIVLGGTAQPGDLRADADPNDTAAILARVAAQVPGLQRPQVREVKVGLRPCRPTVRLEAERLAGGRRLVHNYGHGGSGYTLAWGCAEEVAALLEA